MYNDGKLSCGSNDEKYIYKRYRHAFSECTWQVEGNSANKFDKLQEI